MFIDIHHGRITMNQRRPLINEIYRSCFSESAAEPDELSDLRAKRRDLEHLLRGRLDGAGDAESWALLDQLLECVNQIESLNCEQYFREGYAYTLRFLAQGLC